MERGGTTLPGERILHAPGTLTRKKKVYFIPGSTGETNQKNGGHTMELREMDSHDKWTMEDILADRVIDSTVCFGGAENRKRSADAVGGGVMATGIW